MAKARSRKKTTTRSLSPRSRSAAKVRGGSTVAQVTPIKAQVVPVGAQVITVRPLRRSF